MFRDCIRHEAVARLVLESTIFTEMFGQLEMSNFEVASGARPGSCGERGGSGRAEEGRRPAPPACAAGCCM